MTPDFLLGSRHENLFTGWRHANHQLRTVLVCSPGQDLHAGHIGEILLMTISGKSTANQLASDRVIVALPRCKACVMRVLQGGRAYLTQDEWDRLNALGQWHRRRSRRRAA